MENVRLTCVKDDLRSGLIADRVQRLVLRNVTWPHAPGAAAPLVTSGVEHLERRDK